MDKESFDEYCNFIFTVLKKHEEEVVNRGFLNSSSEKTYARVPGYLGELLTNAYIQYSFQKGKKIKVLPVLFLEENDSQERRKTLMQLLKRSTQEPTLSLHVSRMSDANFAERMV